MICAEIAGMLAITEKGREMATNELEMTGRFLAIAMKNDPKILAGATAALADDDHNWQDVLADDPAYIEWLEAQAEMEDYRHARW